MGRTDYFNDPSAPRANSLKPAVSAVVLDGAGRLLLIRRTDNDRYAIPGGAQECGETVTEAVVREVEEETGVVVVVTSLVGIFSNPAHVVAFSDGEVRQEFSMCFRAVPTGGAPRASDESKEVRWVAPEDLRVLDIHPSIRLRIERGLADPTSPYFT